MITHQVKNWTILILFVLLAVSGTLNILQLNSAKREQQARMIDHERSNTIIAGKNAEIAMHQATINEIRKDRSKDSLQAMMSQASFKDQIGKLRLKISQLPQQIIYNPDSATVDSLRVAFVLKDSVIDTQALRITSLEVEKEGIVYSFYKEIALLEQQRAAQVDISNQLQTQLVSAQTQTRKEVRRKKFWRGAAMVVTGGIAVLLLSPK